MLAGGGGAGGGAALVTTPTFISESVFVNPNPPHSPAVPVAIPGSITPPELAVAAEPLASAAASVTHTPTRSEVRTDTRPNSFR